MAWEADVLMFAKHKNVDLLAGVLLAGDAEQLFVLTPSILQKGPINEFGHQISLSLLSRLIWGGFPSVEMSEQYRMHPDLSRFVSSRSYNGRMTNGAGCENLVLSEILKAVLQAYLGVSRHTKVNLIHLDVSDSCMHKEIATAWTVQGKQWDVVFLDQVISSGEQMSDFGITQTEELQNVMHSRTRRMLWEIVPSKITEGFFDSNDEQVRKRKKHWQDAMREKLPGIKPFHPKLYVVDHIDERIGRRQTFDKSGESIGNETFADQAEFLQAPQEVLSEVEDGGIRDTTAGTETGAGGWDNTTDTTGQQAVAGIETGAGGWENNTVTSTSAQEPPGKFGGSQKWRMVSRKHKSKPEADVLADG
ncbi:hypothetical protein P7C71_g1591, partial [Lecanoromycetidae sp. Uapishka_2]